MTAITFNGRDAIKWGATDLDRVYAGNTLVWSKATGLPYSTTFSDTPGAVGSAWTVLTGTWKAGSTGGQTGITTLIGPVAIALHSTIRAGNVNITARVTADGAGAYIGLIARATGNTYYLGEYADVPPAGVTPGNSIMRIVKVVGGVRTVLGTWTLVRVATTLMSFSAVGSTLTISRGSTVNSVTDAQLTYGAIGIEGDNTGGINTLNATAV
jgi:hypothetical protein